MSESRQVGIPWVFAGDTANSPEKAVGEEGAPRKDDCQSN